MENKNSKPKNKEYTAKKVLFTVDGVKVLAGDKVTCTEAQAKHFKKNKAI